MKIKTGTDMIEIERVQKSIENTDGKFCDRVYTANEIKYCESKNVQKYQHYAARFAAKEATFKAISKSLNGKYDIDWKDIEVENDENGNGKNAENYRNTYVMNYSSVDINVIDEVVEALYELIKP